MTPVEMILFLCAFVCANQLFEVQVARDFSFKFTEPFYWNKQSAFAPWTNVTKTFAELCAAVQKV